MSASELDNRNIAISMRKSVENLVISSQDAIGQSISQALTFSGVITSHTNQIIQDINVSRSPSPARRIIDNGADLIENDKGSESPSPALAGGDAVTATLDVAFIANTRPENPKVVIPNQYARNSDGGIARTKKKSWYNSLYPTYKSKSDDFKRLFKELPDDERLIVDYSCALQRDILMHGRLYASQNYLCFYANIFSWETSLAIRWKDVTAITKEKTALVIPNAILVCTESEKNFLTSFSGRDKSYLMLFRIWQNALMDQPLSTQEIWQWVHSCYGEELGFNSEDEGYHRDHDAPPTPEISEQELVDSSIEAGGGDGKDTSSLSLHRDSSPPLVTNGDSEYRDEAGDTLPTDMSDTSDSEPDKPHNGAEAEKCTATHEGKLLLHQEFPFNIDQIFTMIFTNSKFNLELLAARNITDYVQAPWQPQGGLKCRQVSYTMGLTSGPIGPKEVHVTETQTMNKCSKPGALYSINASSENAGIPYADYFAVEVHYCLLRLADHLTLISVYGHVRYKKSMWPMVKTFLEKNTISGLEDFCKTLEAKLNVEAECAAPAQRHSRRHRRLTASSTESCAQSRVAPPSMRGASLRGARLSAPPAAPLAPRTPPAAGAPAAPRWLLGALLVLLAVNALLYWTLYCGERRLIDVDHLHDRMSSGSGSAMSEWSMLLEQHSHRQRGQLRAWKVALDRTVALLTQTEQALAKLLETIKPSLEQAQAEAEGETAPHTEL